MNTNQVYRALKNSSKLEYMLINTYVYNWECDIFGLTKAGYATEVEIKTSRADFLADFKKVDKHKMLQMASLKKKVYTKRHNLYYSYDHVWVDFKNEKRFRSNQRGATQELEPPKMENRRNPKPLFTSISFKKVFAPNKFWYVCPEGMVKGEEVPEYAGLYWLCENGGLECVKKAPFIHKVRFELAPLLLHKFHLKCLNLEGENENLKEYIDYINTMCLSDQIEFDPNYKNNQVIF